MDEMVVRVACAAGLQESIEEALVAQAISAVQVRPRIEFVAAAQIYDPGRETKAARFVDARSVTRT
jgi:hypothetical protein